MTFSNHIYQPHISAPKLLSLATFIIFAIEIHYGYGSETFKFNREMTGVSFSPYVKHFDGEKFTFCLNQYTFDELKTMVEIISSKFSRLMTESMDAIDDVYIPGETYYNNACIIARTAEAAAVINRERNATSLSVVIGIMNYHNEERRSETEVNLAVEAFQIANSIYPGTVTGFKFSNVLTDNQSAIFGEELRKNLKNQTLGSGVPVGIIATFKDFENMELREDRIMLFKDSTDKDPRMTLIANSDIITYNFFADTSQDIDNATENFLLSNTLVFIYKGLLERLNRNTTTMGCTGWNHADNYSFQNIQNLQEYWIAGNEFAINKKFPIWFHEAFDNPWRSEYPYYGWWRLEENSEADNVTGYVENILSPRNRTLTDAASSGFTLTNKTPLQENFWIWPTVVIIASGLVIIVPLASLLRLYHMKRSLQTFVISKKEIADFNDGLRYEEICGAGYELYVCGSAMQQPYEKSLEVSEEKLEIYWDRVLGAGEFGTVHKALLKGKTPKEIAIKSPKKNSSSTATAVRGLMSEIKILTHLGSHPYIVSICGAYTAELIDGKVYVALELCSMGSLKKHLMTILAKKFSSEDKDNEIHSFAQQNLLRWSLEIATGMEHISHKGVIHADLAARNVLLTNDYTAKIADFGLSKRMYEYEKYVKTNQERLPWKWMSLEALKTGQFSIKSDIWSFGVTMWEIFSLGAEPYPGYSFNSSFIECLENGSALMSRPSEATPEIHRLMLDCWNLQADLRPSFGELKSQISDIWTDINYEDVFV